MKNCNICAVDNCHKFMGFGVVCRRYLPLDTFKISILEHLFVKNSKSVAQLLSKFDFKVHPINEYPGFILNHETI